MTKTEEKQKRINSFISLCLDGKDEPPKNKTFRDISKVVSERYATQDVEVVRVFFRSKGSIGNNKPYTYPEELPVGTATMISDDLLQARTATSIGYGEIVDIPKEESDKPTEIDPKLMELLS